MTINENIYKDINYVIEKLILKYHNIPQTDVEILVWDKAEALLDKYNPEKGKFRGFLYIAANNYIKDFYRRGKYPTRSPKEGDIVYDNDFLLYLENEFFDKLEEIVDRLDPLQVNILFLHLIGHTDKSIAEQLNIHKNTIFRQRHKILNMLKEELKDYGQIVQRQSFYTAKDL